MLRLKARWLALALVLAPIAVAEAAPTGNAVFDKVVEIVNQRFYSDAGLGTFNDAVAAVVARLPELGTAAPESATTRAAVNTVLASLGASHTGRYTPDQQNYYELSDVFRGAFRRDATRVFPPQGEPMYEGIGIAAERVDGKVFVTDVYDGDPAARAKIMPGDEIVSVDGQPYDEIGSFLGKSGGTVSVMLRHTTDAEPVMASVAVEKIAPGRNFLDAIRNSIQVIDRGGHEIGVVHLWIYTSDQVTGILYQEIAAGKLKDVDGLVLDLRSRWGGTPADAGETFLGGTADMYVVERDGKIQYLNQRFKKPVVAIIDKGTRSGMELLAYSLKKNGVPLIGTETAGDVLAATGFLLPDDSLLELAVEDVFVDGKRLEANPVQPDVAVPFDVHYANGRDPQFDTAMDVLLKRLSGA
jgi:C-terminal processing protease CtpA/Prc